ncbi:MBL fold metallo-hydrolase, partial [Pseudomonas shirazensis]
RKLGVDRLDVLLISHAHADHAGGAAAVQRGLSVERVVVGESEQAFQAQSCETGQGWRWDGVDFSLWHWPQGRSS